MKVLLVEDDPSLCTFFKRALLRAGYEPTTLLRGDEGLIAATTSEFDLIVLDGYLPGVDGMDILKELRLRGDETPILMLSGSGDRAREQALEAGANAFLPKPCGLDDLTNAVAILTSRSLVRDLSARVAA